MNAKRLTPDELALTLAAKGYVRTGSGWRKPAGPLPQTDPGAPELEATSQNGHGETGGQLPHPELQEREAMDHEASEREAFETALPDYVPGVSGVDGESRPEFRISVTLYVSNRVRRDPTGAFETLCDVITATRRRLRERLTGRFLEGGASPARRRRRPDRNPKTVKEPLPF